MRFHPPSITTLISICLLYFRRFSVIDCFHEAWKFLQKSTNSYKCQNLCVCLFLCYSFTQKKLQASQQCDGGEGLPIVHHADKLPISNLDKFFRKILFRCPRVCLFLYTVTVIYLHVKTGGARTGFVSALLGFPSERVTNKQFIGNEILMTSYKVWLMAAGHEIETSVG